MTRDILVFVEILHGAITETSFEVLSAGRRLADELHSQLLCAIITSKDNGYVSDAITYGADKVYLVEDALLEYYSPDLSLGVLERLSTTVNPILVLLPHDSSGSDIGPKLGFRLGCGVTTDCIDFIVDQGDLLCVKNIYGGAIKSVLQNQSDINVATLRKRIFPKERRDYERRGEVIAFDANLGSIRSGINFIEHIAETEEGPRLEDADVVVCGGRGLGSRDGFMQLEGLASILKGVVAGSRPACENGWLSSRQQVGLTGATVSPKLYIAVGISGAVQHMTGCFGSKVIVAINKDADAPIFKQAHYGVVGDFKEVLSGFIEHVEEIITS